MNVHIILDARAVADPEKIDLKDGKKLTKLRVADNPPGKKDPKRPARFTTCKAFGAQADSMLRLVKGDVISVTGQLGLEAYTDKDGNQKTADVLVVQSFRVQKSDAFFGEKPDKPAEALDDLFAVGGQS